MDEKEISVGDSLYESIQTGLLNFDHTVVVLSAAGLKRPWIRREIATAYNLEIESGRNKILPVLTEDCVIPPFLKDKRYADFRKRYSSGLAELLDALDTDRRKPSLTDLRVRDAVLILDISRRDGSIVYSDHRRTIISLRDGITGDVEEAECDGSVSDFRATPGRITDIWKELGTTYIRTAFPKPLMRNERIRCALAYKMSNAFMAASEWWETLHTHPADFSKTIIKFPRSRPPKSWRVEERDATVIVPSHHAARLRTVGGRATLTLRVDNPKLYRGYIVRWTW